MDLPSLHSLFDGFLIFSSALTLAVIAVAGLGLVRGNRSIAFL